MANIQYVLPEEIGNLLNSTMSPPHTREQVYQQCENSGDILPGSQMRFNIPASDICDFRDSYIQVVLTPDNVVPQVSEVIVWRLLDVTGVAAPATLARWQLEYEGFTTDPMNQAISNANIVANLNLLPSIVNAGLVGFITAANTLTIDGRLTLTINNPGNKLITRRNYINVVSANATDGVQILMWDNNSTVPGSYQYPFLEYGIGSIVDKVMVEINSEVFTEIENYYMLWSIVSKLKLVDHRRTAGRILYNQGSQQNLVFTGPKKFAIPLYGVGILDNIFPLSQIPGIQFRITLRLAENRIALVSNTAVNPTVSYHVSSCKFYYHVMKYSKETLNAIDSKLTGGGLSYGFDNWLTFTDTLTGTTSDKILNFNVRKFLGICAVMRQQSFYNDPTNIYKNASFIKNFISSYRLKVGSSYYPKDRVDLLSTNNDVVEAWIEVARFFGIFRPLTMDPDINDESLAELNYTANTHSDLTYEDNGRPNLPSFMMAISTDASARDNPEMGRHDYPTGIDTSGQVNITLELRNYTLQSDNTLYAFGKFLGMCTLTNRGAVYTK